MASKNYMMKAEARDVAGKGAARALRREHKVPGVVYGDGKPPIKVTLPSKEVNLEYRKGHMMTTLCNLVVGNENHLVLARDVQLHVLKDTVEHVDFLRVSAKTKLVVEIPLHFINEEASPGMSEKGILNVANHTIELLCQATNIPEHIEVDLTPFNIGDSIKLSDAKLPAGATPVIDDPEEFTIATITAPRSQEEIDAEEAANAAAIAATAEAGEAENAAVAAEANKEGDGKPDDKGKAKKEE